MEFMELGDLKHLLSEHPTGLSGRIAKKLGRDILQGLQYLHSHDPPIIHRDLKPANILLSIDGCFPLAKIAGALHISPQFPSMSNLSEQILGFQELLKI